MSSRQETTPFELHVGDVVTIHQGGSPQQCFTVIAEGDGFRLRPSTNGEGPADHSWPTLWLDAAAVTQEQLGSSGECHVCDHGLHDNTLLTVPGERASNDADWESCHCGHDYQNHSFHVLFCRYCPCDSFHHAGETYDQITDRWN